MSCFLPESDRSTSRRTGLYLPLPIHLLPRRPILHIKPLYLLLARARGKTLLRILPPSNTTRPSTISSTSASPSSSSSSSYLTHTPQKGRKGSRDEARAMAAIASESMRGASLPPLDPTSDPSSGPVDPVASAVASAPPSTNINLKPVRYATNMDALLRRGDPVARDSFVDLFLHASAYIAGHRDNTFVIVIPGEAFEDERVIEDILDNVTLLHALQVRCVVILGCFPQIEARIASRGLQSSFSDGYLVTLPEMVPCALEAAGVVRSIAEARLRFVVMSRLFVTPSVRRYRAGQPNRLHPSRYSFHPPSCLLFL